jgi:lipid A 3-O-deacylase
MNFKLFLFLAAFLAVVNVFGQTHSAEIGIQTDNDSYLAQGSDRYYTDGLFIYYRRAMDVHNSADSSLVNKILGFEIGQKIFNPQSGSVPGPQYVDRPFAGYLYVGSTLNLLFKNESNLKLGANLGIVGPASGAEAVQTFVHKNFGFYTPEGWQYQIKNNIELNLSAQYNRLIARDGWADVSLASYVNLGNGFTGAGAGPLIRLGVFNQLYNSESTQSTASKNGSLKPLNSHEIFFYYKPQVNYVAYDATIQGGLFDKHTDPTSLEITLNKEPFVFSQQFGIELTTKRFIFDVAAIFHTKDVKQMEQSHQWGSVTGIYRFR